MKAKAADEGTARNGRLRALGNAGERAGVCRASERVSGRGRGDPLHFQGKGLTKAGRGVS